MSRHPAFPLSSRMFGFAWVSSSITDTGGSIEAGWHEGRCLVVPTYLKDISTNAAQSAKFWLNPVALARNLGFSPVELRRIQRMLKENEAILLEKWNARFGS